MGSRRPRRLPVWFAVFIEVLEKNGKPCVACELAGQHRQNLYQMMNRREDARAAVDAAIALYEARRREAIRAHALAKLSAA